MTKYQHRALRRSAVDISLTFCRPAADCYYVSTLTSLDVRRALRIRARTFLAAYRANLEASSRWRSCKRSRTHLHATRELEGPPEPWRAPLSGLRQFHSGMASGLIRSWHFPRRFYRVWRRSPYCSLASRLYLLLPQHQTPGFPSKYHMPLHGSLASYRDGLMPPLMGLSPSGDTVTNLV